MSCEWRGEFWKSIVLGVFVLAFPGMVRAQVSQLAPAIAFDLGEQPGLIQSPAHPLKLAVSSSLSPAIVSSHSVTAPFAGSQEPVVPRDNSLVTETPIETATSRRPSYLPPQVPISQINISVVSKAKGDIDARPESREAMLMRDFSAVQGAAITEMPAWSASYAGRPNEALAYQPLYFEEANLERYGRSMGYLQPALSTVHFFGTVPLLPYKMTVHRPNQAYCWRWPYPAGRSAPRVREHAPFQWKAAAVEGVALTGVAFLIP